MARGAQAKELLYVQIGRRIKSIRKSAGVTQEDLARDLDITRTSLTNMEAGRQRMQVLMIYAIAARLECDVNELLPPMSGKLFDDGEELMGRIMQKAMELAEEMILDEE